MPRPRSNRALQLTLRELQYLRLLMSMPEPTLAQIADAMHLSTKTVEKHRYKLMRKLGVKTTLELYLEAVRRGLVGCACGKGECGEGEGHIGRKEADELPTLPNRRG